MPVEVKPQHCIICTKLIPADRRKDSYTCSKECTKLRAEFIRHTNALKLCKYCSRPSTPEERERFGAWRRWEAKGGDPAALLKENARLKRQLAHLKKNLPTVPGVEL